MTPTVKRPNAQRDAVIFPQTFEGDVLPHQPQVSVPEVAIPQSEEGRLVGGAEGGLTGEAAETLGSGLGLAPPHDVVGTAPDAGFRGNGLPLQGNADGLLLHKPRNELLNIDNVTSMKGFDLVL